MSHLDGIPPAAVAAIRRAAELSASQAPPFSPERLQRLEVLLRRPPVRKEGRAA